MAFANFSRTMPQALSTNKDEHGEPEKYPHRLVLDAKSQPDDVGLMDQVNPVGKRSHQGNPFGRRRPFREQARNAGHG